MDNDSITWSVKLERHAFGTFSIAYKQAHPLRRRDFVRIDNGSNFIFVGLFKVNGISEEASCFLFEHFLENLKVYAKDSSWFSVEYLEHALCDTGRDFNDRKTSPIDIGASCLALVFDGVHLHLLNAEDSRALVVEEALIEQLTTIHNRPYCTQLFGQSIVVGTPQYRTKRLAVSNKFMIVASRGLWKVLRNEEAVHIVQSNPPDDDITIAVIFLDYELLHQHFTFPNPKVQFYSSYLPPATQEEDLGRMIKSRDLKRHPYGELSAAAIEAHEIMKTYCHLKIGGDGLFFGIFDGGHSEKASHFLANNLYKTLKGIVGDTESIGIDSLRREKIFFVMQLGIQTQVVLQES
ncbi:hypothetical protein SLEP1_g19887 [Rubroshorea leprosula]|uniref:PPM-type phosphatase domain-containing protein n=1 Tax=Rubroshorea leprosula TaxID=152421 RepID=A0AAV5J9Q0_9ROSI|nr:hypothetical protein SLEP1_g19887 [Rubroshorea leprosula]